MNKRFFSSCAAVLLVSACIVSTSGCANTRINPNRNNITGAPQGFVNPQNNTPIMPGVTGNMTGLGDAAPGITDRVPGTVAQNMQAPRAELYDRSKSDNIKSQLGKMSEITQPNVIVVGNTAIVGCKPSNANVDVSGTKNAVINKVKQSDPSINNVLVSTSKDILTRIGTIANDLTSNRPAQDTNNQLAKLVQDIIPAAR